MYIIYNIESRVVRLAVCVYNIIIRIESSEVSGVCI